MDDTTPRRAAVIPLGNPAVVMIGCNRCPQNESQQVPLASLKQLCDMITSEKVITCNSCHSRWVLDTIRIDAVISREDPSDKIGILPRYHPLAPFGRVEVHNIVSRDALIEQTVAEATATLAEVEQ